MGFLYYFPTDLVAVTVVAQRDSAGAEITVDDGNRLGNVWPKDVIILRDSVVLTVLAISGRVDNVLTFDEAADGYVDAALVEGDLLIIEPTVAAFAPLRALALFGSVGSGSLTLATYADDDAPSPSVYLSLDSLDDNDAPMICRKDADGNVTMIEAVAT